MDVTMTDIARRLMIAQSTVSRVLNGKDQGRVSSGKAELIRKTARVMGYRINWAAVSLRKRKSFAIGILLPSPRDSFVGKLVAELQHLIGQTDYTANFAFWETFSGAENSARNVLARRMDAIITCEPRFLPNPVGLPVVAYINYDKRFDFIGFDWEESISLGLDHLWSLGHRAIGYIGGFKRIRKNGALAKRLAQRGLPPLPERTSATYNVFEGDWEDHVKRDFERLWNRADRPTAILAQNDATAIVVLRQAWAAGVNVPRELSVIGMDNIPSAGTCVPALTTVDNFSGISVAELMLKNIFDRLEHPDMPLRKVIARGKLIQRESCAPPWRRRK